MDVASDRLTTLQRMVLHLWVYARHKLDLVSYFKKRAWEDRELGRVGKWGVDLVAIRRKNGSDYDQNILYLILKELIKKYAKFQKVI